jgi:hypothetical protein
MTRYRSAENVSHDNTPLVGKERVSLPGMAHVFGTR